MGALDKIKQADEQQQTMEMLEALTSTLPAVERQLTTLTKTVADLIGFLKVMDEQQDKRLTRLTSQQSAPDSTHDDVEMKNRLSEIEKTLVNMSEVLSLSKTVKLPSGEDVASSDLSAYSMMLKVNTVSADLADAVRKRGTIRVDTDALTAHAVKVLDARLARAVDASLSRVETTVAGFEQRVASLGAERLAEVSAEVAGATVKAGELVRAANAAERRVDTLAARVTWTTAGRFALALVPLASVLVVVGGMTMGVAHALGIGPLLGWAWESFAAAEAWWCKALIAVGTLGGVAVFCVIIWWLAKKIKVEFGRW